MPLFFDGLGLPLREKEHKEVEERLGPVPYLGGGLFRAGGDDFEATLLGLEGDDLRPTRRVVLPDDLFDPNLDKPAPTGKKKGRSERTILGLLRGYRFTTQESTPDDQSVDPDPELLGKVFENLYQAEERAYTGAYYTPREIVHYMCRQAIDGYLTEQTGIPQEDIDWIRAEAADWTTSDRTLGKELSDKVHNALAEVKIIDPAVGSGAFLLASIHEIVLLRRGIWQSENDRFLERGSSEVTEWKRQAATNSVYGVDINPMAVEICHLRLLLSTVVDLEISDYREIPALPDLDFRVLAGDSLIDRMGEVAFIQSLPPPPEHEFDMFVRADVKDLQEKVVRWRDEFTGEGVERRRAKTLRDLRGKIRQAQINIATIQLDWEIKHATERLPELTRKKATQKASKGAEAHLANLQLLRRGLESAPFQKPFLWSVNFPEVFDKGGFDIVVANPPYVRQEKLDAVDQQAYQHAFGDVYSGMADLLVYFYERAVQVLRGGGQLAFITSNKYMRAAYGAGVRAFLPKRLQIRQVIDFGDLPLFSVAAYPAVLIGAKIDEPDADAAVEVADLVYPVRKKLAEDDLTVNFENVRQVLDGLPRMLEEKAAKDYPQELLRSSGWILEDPRLVRLFERLMSEGTPLGEQVAGRMYRGVVTGLNEAFVIDQAKRDELIATDPRSVEVIKLWLRGRDIRPWKAEWAGLYVIFTRRGIDIDNYPAVRDHLAAWREYLEPKKPGDPPTKPGRKPGDYRWFEVQDNVAYFAELEGPKVLWPDLAYSPRFLYDTSGSYTDTTIFQCVGLDAAHSALLNSPVSAFLQYCLCPSMRGGYLRPKIQYLKLFPIPSLNGQMRRDLLSVAQTGNESSLFQLSCEAMGIGGSERQILSSWLKKRQYLAPGAAELSLEEEAEDD